MDPVSVFGIAAGALQIAQAITCTVQGLSTLRGKLSGADLTLRLLISELSTIKSAVMQLHDWAEYNSEGSPKHLEYMNGLNIALDGCHAAIEVLAEDVDDLTEGAPVGQLVALGLMQRASFAWNEPTMKAHQERLHAQVQALSLLLHAGQCHSSSEQLALLRIASNQRIIKKVADDASTLRASRSVANSEAAGTVRGSGHSAIGSTVFDFDDELVTAPMYRRTLAHVRSKSNNRTENPELSLNATNLGLSRADTTASTSTSTSTSDAKHGRTFSASPTEEGYMTGATSLTSGSIKSRHMEKRLSGRPVPPRNVMISEPNTIYRSRSTVLGPQMSGQNLAIKRWQSTSVQPQFKITEAPKRKFSLASFRRNNTSSTSSINLPIPETPHLSPSMGTRRGRRGQETDFNISIDFSSADGLTAPMIVRAAQAGSTVEVERLIDNGADTEDVHLSTGRTALGVAAHCGNKEVVKTLLNHNAALEVKDASGATPLHLAAARGHCEVLDTLLCESPAVDAKDDAGRTALWIAADNGHLEAVDLLLGNNAKVSTRSGDQTTALHVAAKRGDTHMIELLMRNGASVDARDDHYMAALHYAAEAGHASALLTLLGKKGDIELPGNGAKTPLLCAAAAGKHTVVELLLRKKASTKAKGDGDMTAVHWAAQNGHCEVIELLLQKKMSVDASNQAGQTPLHLAVMHGHFEAVELLLRKHAALEARCHSQFAPLHYACSNNNTAIARLLLNAGAWVEAQTDDTLCRPIHIAVSNNCLGIVKILFEKSADLNVRDSSGDRPLSLACHYGYPEIVDLLLNKGSPMRLIYSKGSHEDSPLCIASKAGHTDIVAQLISRGDSVRQKDEVGWPPIRYAAYYGHPDVLTLLLSQGASLTGDTFGINPGADPSAEHIGFAPNVPLSDERKSQVLDILEQVEIREKAEQYGQQASSVGQSSQRTTYTPAYSTRGYYAPTAYNPAANAPFIPKQPSELPSTLAHGLPSSRSATPERLSRPTDPPTQEELVERLSKTLNHPSFKPATTPDPVLPPTLRETLASRAVTDTMTQPYADYTAPPVPNNPPPQYQARVEEANVEETYTVDESLYAPPPRPSAPAPPLPEETADTPVSTEAPTSPDFSVHRYVAPDPPQLQLNLSRSDTDEFASFLDPDFSLRKKLPTPAAHIFELP